MAVRIRRPGAVLRGAASIPSQTGFPGASALSDNLTSLVDSLPSVQSLPSPIAIASLPPLPNPRGVASNFEGALPAATPRFSQFFPDINFDNGGGMERGLRSTISDSYREIQVTQGRTAIRAGGYRSI
jgi:hypothetical protein